MFLSFQWGKQRIALYEKAKENPNSYDVPNGDTGKARGYQLSYTDHNLLQEHLN